MQKETRIECAKSTLAVLEAGNYINASNQRIDLHQTLKDSVSNTRFYEAAMLQRTPLNRELKSTKISVTQETTMQALEAAVKQPGGHIACLNFASAKNAGGGFLTGAQAQEESLARSSGLYKCLLTQSQYYERNRANRSTLYLDLAIYSPAVPFIRNDSGDLLDEPYLASVITCPAPNAGAVRQNEPSNVSLIAPTLERRAHFVLTIAEREGVARLILGAWGCGVFRNDPRLVAATFQRLLQQGGDFHGVFDEVVFAVYDSSKDGLVYSAFESVYK